MGKAFFCALLGMTSGIGGLVLSFSQNPNYVLIGFLGVVCIVLMLVGAHFNK